MIELAKALGWPVAIVIVAFVTLAVVWRLTGATGSFRIKLKDWLNLERDAPSSPAISEKPQAVKPIEEGPATFAGVPDDKSSAITETAEEEQAKAPDKVSRHFAIEDDPKKMADAFSEFRTEEAYTQDMDFWESFYVERRRELNVGNEEEELRALVAQNPTWIWPLLYLIRRCVRLHDPARAEEFLEAALARDNAEGKRWVLREGVALYNELFGFDRALQFAQEQLQGNLNDIDVASMLRKLAEYGKKDDPFSQAILNEIANNLHYDRDSIFQLAYSYGGMDEFHVLAFERYRTLKSDKSSWNAANNMGVIVTGVQSLESHYIEQSLSHGSPVSYANIARMLVTDGFLDRAQALLDTAPAEPDAEGAAALADARAKLTLAQRKLAEQMRDYEGFSQAQDRRYKALMFAAFEYFKTKGPQGIGGAFLSKDRAVGLLVAGGTSHCAIKLPDRTLGGRLAKKPLCYEGSISSSGSGGLLDYASRRVLTVQVSDDEFRAIIWPAKFDLKEPLQIAELQRVASFEIDIANESADVTHENAVKLLASDRPPDA